MSHAPAASPKKTYPSGHHGGWATQGMAEEMLGGQHQRVDTSLPMPELSTKASPAEKTGRKSLINYSSCPNNPFRQGTELN